jgi:hydrogenase-4 component F
MSALLFALIGVPLAASLLSLGCGRRPLEEALHSRRLAEALHSRRLAGALRGRRLAETLGGWRLAGAASALGGLASLGLALALALSVAHGGVLRAADGWIRLDPLGAVFLLATALVYAAAAIFSLGYVGGEQRAARPGGTDRPVCKRPSQDAAATAYARRYFALLDLFGWTMLIVPLTADFGTLWVAVELTTIVSALLVAIDRTDAALEASWKYVLIASSGLGIALLAIIVLYATGTHALGDTYLPRFARLLAHARGFSADAVRLSFVLALVGFGTKVGFVPVHTWLPDAHSEAPAPVSALLSGSLLACALYAILRVFQVAVAAGQRSFAEHALIVFGVLSLILAALFVLRQRNFKRLLAYSSIEHMGVIALGVGFGAPLAVAGALLHVITHASAKGLAFLGSGSLMRGYDTKEIEQVSGAGVLMPASGPMFLAAALALSGLPLSGVFRSEFEIVAGGFAGSQYAGVAILLALVNLAFLGIIAHAGRMVLSAPAGQRARESSGWMLAGMGGCLFVVVALGLHLPGALATLLSSARHLLVPALAR